MASNPQTTDLRENLILRSDLVFSVPGAVLRISFCVRFELRNAARLALSANGVPLRELGGADYGPGGDMGGNGTRTEMGEEEEGAWTRVEMDYTTRDRLLQLTFSYELDAAAENTIWLDQVAIFPYDPFSPPVPVSIAPTPTPPPAAATTFARAVRAAVVGR